MRDVRLLVTGAAGFVGMHACRRLLGSGLDVVGVDNFTPYYSTQLKRDRVAFLDAIAEGSWEFRTVDLSDGDATERLFAEVAPTTVIHLAAQAGVRYSLEDPRSYIRNNIDAFGNILEGCRHGSVDQLIYASSSSVYGANAKLPYSTDDPADHPINLYAATKRSNELMAHSYSHLFGLSTTGLRFFTVYGPWGRPDMAYYKFTEAIAAGKPIEIYGDGEQVRDFTYVDDVVAAIQALAERPAKPNDAWSSGALDLASSSAPWRVLNIGHGGQATVNELIALLEASLGRPAERLYSSSQSGDMRVTHADTEALAEIVGFVPQVGLAAGLSEFVDWYLNYTNQDRADGEGAGR